MSKINLDLATLRMVKTRDRYSRFASMIPAGTINRESVSILRAMGDFFKKTDADRITVENFWPILRTRYPNWSEEKAKEWHLLVLPLDRDNPHGMDEQIIENLLTTSLATELVDYISKWQAGEEVDLPLTIREKIETFEDSLSRKIKTPDVQLGWAEMLAVDEHNIGLHWRLECLQQHLRALRPGDFGILAMRPDQGKTSLGASEIAGMAEQLKELYPDEFRPVVWLNNEGPGERILSRIRQAVLGMSATEIREIGADEAQRRYIEALGGREDRIQVLDIHSFTSWEVEELIRKKNPALVIFDMIDNIKFGGATINGGERTDQILEAMYQWARVLGVKYKFAGIAMSQLSGDAEGMRFPTQAMLKDSKTGKQGACDFIITGGTDPNSPMTRYIGAPKNKLKREGMPSTPKAEVWFDMDRCRMREVTTVEEE